MQVNLIKIIDEALIYRVLFIRFLQKMQEEYF